MVQGNAAASAGDGNRHEWERDSPGGQRTRAHADSGERPSGRGKRRFRAIRLHRQFAPVLVAVTLLCTLGLTALTYVGARSYAISGAEARALQNIQVEQRLILPPGAALHLQDGRLTVMSAAAPLVLNNDTTLVDQTRALIAAHVTIYQAEGSRLVAISTTLPDADKRGAIIPGSRALGDALTGPALESLQGACTVTSPPSCHETYQGIITVRGISYAAALTPLYDANGTYVGALSVAAPLDAVTAPATQLAVMLLIAGLLLALMSLVAGFWFFGTHANRTFGALDLHLHAVADAAAELERLAQLQATRAGRQDRVAQQVSEQIRALDAMAEVMEQGRAALRDTSGEVWAEMSQPGALPNPGNAVRLAQQAAVSAAQVGSAAEDARDLCRHLVGLMNHVIAEGAIVGDGGLEMESRAKDLRVAIEAVEMTVGERLLQRSLILRRMRAVSERVRRYLPAPFSAESPNDGADPDQPPTALSAATGQSPTPRRLPAQQHRSPERQWPNQQQQRQRKPPRVIQTGELPAVQPGERPNSGLLRGRGPAEPSLPRGARPPRTPPPGDWNPGGSRNSGRRG